MLSLNNLRTKFGVVLVVVIGAVLLAFVLGDMLRNPQQAAQNPVIGEIGGDEVEYSEFYNTYEEIRALNENGNAAYDQSAQFVQMAWQALLFDRVLAPQMEKLGITYTADEREAVLKGDLASAVLSSAFGVDGKYNPEILAMFLQNSASNEQSAYIWELLEKQIRNERLAGKYMDLIRSGAYVNSLMVKKSLIGANNTYKGHFVACNYSTVADSLVSVSDKEVEKYYEANKAKFKQTPFRTVRYVSFKDAPSAEDKAAIEATAKLQGAEFAAAADLNSYASSKTYANIEDTYTSAEALSSDESTALRAGKIYGPQLRGNEWYASRVVKTVVAPKTIELQQMIFPMGQSKLADSIYLAAKAPRADFAALAPQGQYADHGELNFSVLPLEWAEKCANAKTNDILKFESNGATLILKVGKVGPKAPHYLLATQTHPVYASNDTKAALYREVCDFARKANGTSKGFDEAAASQPTQSMNVKRGDRNIPGLSNSIEVVRWANKAKVGDVSDIIKIGEDYVIAVVVAIDEAEYKSLAVASTEIKNVLKAQKKAALLKEKMQGATLEEIAKNAGATVKEFSDVKTSSNLIGGMGLEPRVVGLLENVTTEGVGKLLPLVEGKNGVYAVVVDEIAVAEEPQTAEAERVKAQAQVEAMAGGRAMWAIQSKADIKDNTPNFL